jgi:hypothetical protein
MKKTKITVFALAAVLSSTPVLAAEIPKEAAPAYLTEEIVCITENLISPILEEVQNGLGFGEAWGKASREIHSAVLAGNTNGYGYADLTAIARNAILQYRDMYLRPDYYAQQEPVIASLIADLITEVENGTMDYATARKEAYTRIYQSIDPGYIPNTDMTTDPIYLDIPAMDSAMFTIARKLLLEAEERSVTS